jgi:polysaccharide export outer membrane protein
MFAKLPKSQQQALAKQYGIDLNALSEKKDATIPPAQTLNELVSPRIIAPTVQEHAKPTSSITEIDQAITSQFDNKKSKEVLAPFGYNLFSGEPSTFAPVTDIPVPNEYILGTGDTIQIQLYGKETQDLDLQVNRRGAIQIPTLGPYMVSGKSFTEVKTLLNKVFAERMIGVKSNISMGALRSIRIFVLGEAYKPASYTLSSLSTVTQALYAAGGINNIGSLRNIQVKRRGKVVATLDFYDLLLNGDTSGDIHLLAGDVVFIPTSGKTVGVKGEVVRPGIYELKGETSLSQVLSIAGGMLPTAYQQIIKIERINQSGLRSVINIDLTAKTSNNPSIQNGDILEVGSVLSTLEHSVSIKGHVARPGIYGWHKNMKLSELLGNINDFKELADLHYILVTRQDFISGELSSYAVDFADFITDGRKSSDFTLASQDTVYVFNKEMNRSYSLNEVLERLKSQARLQDPPKVVTISGAVNNPGSYPLTYNANIQDLLRASMGYKQHAELEFALMARVDMNNFQTRIFYIDLTDKSTNTVKLSPLDRVFVFNKKKPRTDLLNELNLELKQQANKLYPQNVINIHGDVRYPGEYPFSVGATPEHLIKLAGGLNESSYLVDAELNRFNHDGIKKSTIEHLQIALPNNDFALKPLDRLFIKRIPDWREPRFVKLKGEVIFPGDYILQQGETLAEVIQRAGGFTAEADLSAAVFARKSLRIKEQEQIERLSDELKAELVTLNVGDTTNDNAISKEEAELLSKRLDDLEAVGRLVINLPSLLAAESSQGTTMKIRLDDGDVLYVPKSSQSVTVIGEVQYPTSHLFNKTIDLNTYITKSGGLKIRADQDRIYIIKSNGSVYNPENDNWFAMHESLSPGDTIVVPLNTEYQDSLIMWSSVTQILYNTAVAVAAISGL